MQTFKHFLTLDEMSTAAKGDWMEAIYFTLQTSEWGIKDKFDVSKSVNIQVPNIKINLILLKDKKKDIYIVGNWVETPRVTKLGNVIERVFNKIFYIELLPNKIAREMGYNNAYTVKVVGVSDENNIRKGGIATFMYKYFINTMNMILVSDEIQYFGARRLWAKLSKEIDISVDIIDTRTKEVLFKNTILHHGDTDSEFDKRMWSYTKEKHFIRSVMTKILD